MSPCNVCKSTGPLWCGLAECMDVEPEKRPSIRQILEDHQTSLDIEIIRDDTGRAVGYYMFCSCKDFKWQPDKDSTEDPFLDHLADILDGRST